MKNFSQKIYTIIAFVLIGFAANTFAVGESQILSEITVTPDGFSGIAMPSQPGYDIQLRLLGTSQNSGKQTSSLLGSFPADAASASFGIAIPNTMQVFSNGVIRNILADDVLIYDKIEVTKVDNGTNTPPLANSAPQVVNLNTVIQGGLNSLATIDFPGWSIAEYREIGNTGQYYPFVQTAGQFSRETLEADVYLVLENKTTNEKFILETYPGGVQYQSITWPTVPVQTSQLVPGNEYAIYLSDVPDGSLRVGYGNSESTYENLGAVSSVRVGTSNQNEVLSINNIVIKKNGSNTYYEISGTVNETVQNSSLLAIVRTAGSSGIGQPIGSISYEEGYEFILPNPIENSFPNFSEGQYELAFKRNILEPDIFDPIVLPPITSTSGTGGSGGTSGTTGGSTVVYNDTQQDVINNGIAPTNCGYNLSKGGKICNFNDAMSLVKRIIEYIFVLILPIAAIIFAYAGFLFLTSGGSADKRKAAKKAMTSVIIGIIVIMAAWIIVKTIVGDLGFNVEPEFSQYLS